MKSLAWLAAVVALGACHKDPKCAPDVESQFAYCKENIGRIADLNNADEVKKAVAECEESRKKDLGVCREIETLGSDKCFKDAIEYYDFCRENVGTFVNTTQPYEVRDALDKCVATLNRSTATCKAVEKASK